MYNEFPETEQSEFNEQDNNNNSNNLIILSEKDPLKDNNNLRSGITAKKYKRLVLAFFSLFSSILEYLQ